MTLSAPVDGRLGVAKTYKLYLGGAFPRSESGRSYPVHDTKGRLLAHAALASRKDLRDAVSAARSAFAGWSGATAYNRGQVLYRVGGDAAGPARSSSSTTWWRPRACAGSRRPRWWTRRSTAGSGTPAGPTRSPRVFGSVNPVAGPLLSWSTPGTDRGGRGAGPAVVGAARAGRRAGPGAGHRLHGGGRRRAGAAAAGGRAGRGAGHLRPAGRAWRTSSPGGSPSWPRGWPRTPRCTALDLTGAPAELAAELERAAADTVKRVLPRPAAEPDPTRAPDVARLRAFTEIKTVWHPVGR